MGNYWDIKNIEERLILSLSQKKNISTILSKLLLSRNIEDEDIDNFLNADIRNSIPNPFLLKDMNKSVERVYLAIERNEKIGIIADYDVDGSTSACILFKFLSKFCRDLYIKIPNRLSEGYGPNIRIMDELFELDVSLIFTLDCGTTSFDIIDNNKYAHIDTIVIDHHLSEISFPKVFSIINPNRYDEGNNFNKMAAVGITFLFIMGLRKKLRDLNFFINNYKEPNLLSFLDMVALGTVCDVVSLVGYNRYFVKMGLDLIKKRKNLAISKIIDNSNIQSTPDSRDLGYIIGPQLNAASRIDDSNLPSKILISENIIEIDKISKKLVLLNEKRKLIETNIYKEAFIQAQNQKNQNYILVYGNDWHSGVLGIVASKLMNFFNKPTIVISFINNIGIGSARSIKFIDLGKIILNAKNKNILISGGGHKMAAGLKINLKSINIFKTYLQESFSKFPIVFFKKIDYFDLEISVNQINDDLIENIEILEPFGADNPEPKFIITDLIIENIKIIKDKHILVFFRNDFSSKMRGIYFNGVGSTLGDYLLNFKIYKFIIACTIKKDNFNDFSSPQIVIKDAMIIN